MACNKVRLRPRHVQVVAASFCTYLADLFSGIDVPEADQRIHRSRYRLFCRENKFAGCDQVRMCGEGMDLLVALPHLVKICPMIRATLHE